MNKSGPAHVTCIELRNIIHDQNLFSLKHSHKAFSSWSFYCQPIYIIILFFFFEVQDDDTNYHMDFIAGLANMRARNYSIPEVDKLKAKFIAGRIIPAIATSTALATGLVCLELYKVLGGRHKVEDYRNMFVNLALPLFTMAEPVPPKVVKHRDMSWTIWDRWIIRENITLRGLLQWLKDKGLNAYSISCGSCLLYNTMFAKHKERLDRRVVDLAREVANVVVPPYKRYLDVMVACDDDDDNDIDIPLISIYFR